MFAKTVLPGNKEYYLDKAGKMYLEKGDELEEVELASITEAQQEEPAEPETEKEPELSREIPGVPRFLADKMPESLVKALTEGGQKLETVYFKNEKGNPDYKQPAYYKTDASRIWKQGNEEQLEGSAMELQSAIAFGQVIGVEPEVYNTQED
jgi:hypothetical protein